MSGERSLPRKLRTERRLTQPVQLNRTEMETPAIKLEVQQGEKPTDSTSQTASQPVPNTQQTTGFLLETDF